MGHDQVQVPWTSSPVPLPPFFSWQILWFRTWFSILPSPMPLRRGNQMWNHMGVPLCTQYRSRQKGQRLLAKMLWILVANLCFRIRMGFCNFTITKGKNPTKCDCWYQHFATEVDHMTGLCVVEKVGQKGGCRIPILFIWILLLPMGEAEWREFKRQNPPISRHPMNFWEPWRQSWTDRFFVLKARTTWYWDLVWIINSTEKLVFLCGRK